MNLTLTENQEAVRSAAREFARRIVLPAAEQIDRNGEIPKEIFRGLAEVDLLGIVISEEFGGLGFGSLEFSLAARELAKASASVAAAYVGTVCAASIIEKFGTEDQKKKYLPDVVKGSTIVAVGTTEPGGGSNWPRTLKTSAVLSEGSYHVHGRKCFISNAEDADLYIISARTDNGNGSPEFSGIIVEKGREGFTFGKREDKLGLRGIKNSELIFRNCPVPEENLVGGKGCLLTEIMPVYGSLYCVGHSAVVAGIAMAALESARSYVKERVVDPSLSLAHFDGVQTKIADLAINTEIVELLSYRTALGRGVKGPDPIVQMASTRSNEMAVKIVNDALVLHGGSGVTKDFPIERFLRDVRTMTFYPAVYDYYRLFAGKVLLDLPLGPSPEKAASAN